MDGSGSALRPTRWIALACWLAVIGVVAFFAARTKMREKAMAAEAAAKEKNAKPREPKLLRVKPRNAVGKKKSDPDVALASATVDINPSTPDKKLARRRVVAAADALEVARDFRVELLWAAELEEGSWICMTKDDRGRLIISGQPGQGVFRATIAGGKVENWERLRLPVSGAMGMLFAHDSLYLTAQGKHGYGIFRCRDTDGDDQFDEFQQILHFAETGENGALEHGPHALELGPDGKIYCIVGNRSEAKDSLEATSPHRNFDKDVLPEVASVRTRKARAARYPGGHVIRFAPDGSQRELVLGGLRNCYDFAFHGGEIFTFDNDAEEDWGLPWYRPARLIHGVSGGEYGWRPKSGSWPEYFEDGLPPVGEVGLGAPTGVLSGRGAKFPAKFQQALFVMDWTYGRILAVHLQPEGASYSATWENFVASASGENSDPVPFNVTDMTVGEDGAIYFIVGGRNSRGCLYRVTYTGTELTQPVAVDAENIADRDLRRQLEQLHGQAEDGAIEMLWPHLGSDDRFLRYAARIALESQPVSEWQAQALAEEMPLAKLNALLALTRVAPPSDQPAVQQALVELPLDELSNAEKLIFLRVCSVNLARHPRLASSEIKSQLIAKIEPLVPTPDEVLNREAMRLLIYLEAPSAVAKSLALISDAQTLQDQMFYITRIADLPSRHWTRSERDTFLKLFSAGRPKLPSEPRLHAWFQDVDREFVEGASFHDYLTELFWQHVKSMPAEERAELEPLIQEVSLSIAPQFEISSLPIQRWWTMEEVAPLLERADAGRNFERGQRAFLAAQCIQCHRLGSAGGSVGPDLTSIARRFSREQIAESILAPSKVISDQFEHSLLATDDGRVLSGRIVEEDSERIVLQTNPLRGERVEIPVSQIEERRASKISPMPEHLVDVLHEEELLDLIAYLESGGSKSYSAFQPADEE